MTSFPSNRDFRPGQVEHGIHHLFAPCDRRHLEKDGEDNTPEDVVQQPNPHPGMVGGCRSEHRVVLSEPVEPCKVLICPEAGQDQILKVVSFPPWRAGMMYMLRPAPGFSGRSS